MNTSASGPQKRKASGTGGPADEPQPQGHEGARPQPKKEPKKRQKKRGPGGIPWTGREDARLNALPRPPAEFDLYNKLEREFSGTADGVTMHSG